MIWFGSHAVSASRTQAATIAPQSHDASSFQPYVQTGATP
jgi:hypothetical protein